MNCGLLRVALLSGQVYRSGLLIVCEVARISLGFEVRNNKKYTNVTFTNRVDHEAERTVLVGQLWYLRCVMCVEHVPTSLVDSYQARKE